MAIDVDTLQKLRTPMEVTPLDLSWLNLEQNGHPWGMRAKPGKRGLTLDEIEIGPPGEVPEHSDNRSVRVRGSEPRPGRPAHPRLLRRPCRRLLREHAPPLRRGCPAPVVLGHGHSLGRDSAASGRHRARDVPALHLPHRGRVHRRRHAGPVAAEDQQRAPRGQALPPHPDHGRGPPPGRLPQARLRQRRRPADLAPAGRPARDHRGEGLHRDVRDHARRRRGLRAVALPHGRVHRPERRGEAHLPDVRPGRVAATSASASCT